MKTLKLTFTAVLLLIAITNINMFGQQDTIEPPPVIKLGGPRFGVTYISGDISVLEENNIDIKPFITQFGWQIETRFFTLPNGTSGLIEVVGLIGGLEQNKFIPSMTGLIGFRNAQGLEFGFGPNLSLSGFALAFCGGVTIKRDYVNFPINFAVVPTQDGMRFSLLFGMNVKGQISIL